MLMRSCLLLLVTILVLLSCVIVFAELLSQGLVWFVSLVVR
jgi:hypothetical protein